MITDIRVNLEQLIALQRSAEHVALINKRAIQTASAGGYLSRFRGRGMTFEETRGYQAGDDIRFMDWRVMARTGQAHTKLFCEERERPLFIVLDQSVNMRFGSRVTFKSVVAAQVASIVAWAAVRQSDKVGGIVFHDSDFQAIKPRGRKQGVLPLLRQIVRMNHEQPTLAGVSQLEHVSKQLRHICHPGGLVFLISDFNGMTPVVQQHLRSVAEKCEMIACFISDPLEREPPPKGYYQITNGEKKWQFDTSSNAFCDEYRQQFSEHHEQVKQLLASQRIPLIDIATTDDVASVLYQSLLKLQGMGRR